MSTAKNCTGCRRQLESDWSVCPFCGKAIVESAQVHAHSETKIASANPYADRIGDEQIVSARQEGRNDLARIGLGLIVGGILGFTGSVAVIVADIKKFLEIVSDPSSQVMFSLLGGILIAMVIAGTSMFVAKGDNPVARGAVGILGILLSGLMILGLALVWIVAAIIFLVQSCFGAGR